jgi:phage gp29-like protein
MPTIYGPNGQVIDFADIDRKNLLQEIATSATVSGMDLGDFLTFLPDPDPVLKKKGEDAKILEDLTADDEVCSSIQNRKLRVLNNSDYDFKPGVLPGKEATKQAKDLCEQLTQDLESIKLKNVFNEILDAPFYGATFVEIMWLAESGKYHLEDLVVKPREWFGFDKDRKPALKKGSSDSIPLPTGKFITVQHFPTYQNPYGLRLLTRCLWPVAFKRGGSEFLTRFLEKFGIPWVKAIAPKNTKLEEKEAMAADLVRMIQDAVMVLPHGAEVDLAESKGRAGDLHLAYLKFWNKAIRKLLTGQTLTSEMDGSGSRAAAQVHMDVAEDISEADQNMVCDAMNELAIIYRDINAPGVEAPVFEYHEPEDSKTQAELDESLHGVGVRFTPAHFERRYGLQPDEFYMDGEQPADSERGDNAGGGFAEGQADHQDLLDQLVDSVLPEAAKRNETFIKRLAGLIQRAESYEDIQILLAEHLGRDMDLDQQAELLTDLMTAADLMGRAAVRAES